jgi:hypothetical protein
MKKSIRLLLLFINAFFTVVSHGQDEQRENKIVTINFKDEKGGTAFFLGDIKIDSTIKTIIIDLNHNDLEIQLTKYKKRHLLKIYLEDSLDCEGLEKPTDDSTKNTKITINNGKLNLDHDYIVGSKIKIVLPQEKRSLNILTRLEGLKKCPGTANTVIVGKVPGDKKEDGFNVGIAYYDALFLAHETDLEKKKQLLQYYAGLPDSLASCERIADSLENNPFLSGFANQICILRAGIGNQQSTKSIASRALSSIGGLDVTNIADGLARFLIRRGKEELNIAFFQRLKEFLENHIEAKTLFPSTVEFLDKIASYRYAEFLPSLREAFYKDINSLVINLNQLIDLPKYQNLLKALPEIRVAVRSAKIISELSQPGESMHPAILINHFAGLTEWGEMNINLASSWKLLDEISHSVRTSPYSVKEYSDTITNLTLRAKDKINPGGFVTDTIKLDNGYYSINRRMAGADTLVRFDTVVTQVIQQKKEITLNNEVAWIKFSDFNNNILKDSNTLKIYLGLLYQRMEGISFRNKGGKIKMVQEYMRENKDNIFIIADLVENFLVLANCVESSIKDIKQHEGNAITKEEYYTYIGKAISVVEYGFKVANTIDEGISGDRYIVMARNANNLYKNIYSKDYNAAIMNAYLILDEIFSKTNQAIIEKQNYFNAARPAALASSAVLKTDSSTFNKSMVALNQSNFLEEDSIDNMTKIVEDILKYGNVIASIVKAESPEEASAAIEAAALPAGSSSIKKNSRFNISLNAYIGGSISNYTNNTDKIDGSNSNVSVTAPVGIAFNWGLGHFSKGKKASRGALSAYLTLIDVGSIAGYRLTNDSTELEQKVTIDDIFTPGGYIVYGIGLPFLEYIPLSIGYGWQYGSKLYYKTSTGTLAVSDKSRWRPNFFIGIDIPLANFWTKGLKGK